METGKGVSANEGQPRGVVVGAGVAGLSAAQHLWAHGFHNLTILEAEDRSTATYWWLHEQFMSHYCPLIKL